MSLEAINLNTVVVRCQLIPLDGIRLVLPNTSIAEVISHQKAEELENLPEWILGSIEWRGVVIPLISFETTITDKPAVNNKRSRIIVINATENVADLPFFGLVAQGIPRLMTLNNEAIIDAPDQDSGPFISRNTLIDGNPAIIPDISQIEIELKKLNIKSKEIF